MKCVFICSIVELVFKRVPSQEWPRVPHDENVESSVEDDENDSNNEIAEACKCMSQSLRIATHLTQANEHEDEGDDGTNENDHAQNDSGL